MQPIRHTLTSGTNLKIIPDTSVYHDGHPIISYTYSIFYDKEKALNIVIPETKTLSSDYVNHPDYLGFITFEEPGKLFSYTAYGDQHLTMEESEELIEHLSHVRDNPSLWPSTDLL